MPFSKGTSSSLFSDDPEENRLLMGTFFTALDRTRPIGSGMPSIWTKCTQPYDNAACIFNVHATKAFVYVHIQYTQ